jgi:hypothetical protein
MKKIFILLFFVLITSSSIAHSELYWAKIYGGINDDYGHSIQETRDGDFIVAGMTHSFGVADEDAWILKLNSSGETLWEKTYGSSSVERFFSIQQTTDDGFIAAGYTGAIGDNTRMWVVKIDSFGNVIWENTYSLGYMDYAYSVQQTSDGGYIVAGFTYTANPNKPPYPGPNYWVIKLDELGNISWQKTYSGCGGAMASFIEQTSDGGYIVTGITNQCEIGKHNDLWVIKLDAFGNITWQKTYGAPGDESTNSKIHQTSDGGYILVGNSRGGAIYSGALVLRLNASGQIIWQKIYIANGYVVPADIKQTLDNGFILTGSSPSNTSGSEYSFPWVQKIDEFGNILWGKIYSEYFGYGYSICSTSSNDYTFLACINSQQNRGIDLMAVKCNPNGEIPNCPLFETVDMEVSNPFILPSGTNIPAVLSNATVIKANLFYKQYMNEVLTSCEGYTLIELTYLEASSDNKKVFINWSTESEIDNSGFNLYRSESEDGEYIKINDSLMPAKGSSTQGASYEFVDKDVKNRKTYYYKLEDINLSGTSIMHGPVSATPRLIYGVGK